MTSLEDNKDIQEIKQSLNYLTAEMDELRKENAKEKGTFKAMSKEITDLKHSLDDLKETVKSKDERIKFLEQNVEELQQYTRKNNIIISGLDTRNYAQVAQNTNLPQAPASEQEEPVAISESENSNVETKVIEFFNKTMKVDIEPEHISDIHYLPTKDGKKNILIHFTSRKSKYKVMKNGRNLKGQKIYVNEHLTKTNSQLFKQARQLKKDKEEVIGAWTYNCKIYVKCEATSYGTRQPIYNIKSMEDFEKYNLI